jgi:y4mF family transcriptional regulator
MTLNHEIDGSLPNGKFMNITSAQDVGLLIKKVRTAQKITQPELAGACGVGVRFIVDLEKGKPTCELEKALMVAAMLGIKLTAQEPATDEEAVQT